MKNILQRVHQGTKKITLSNGKNIAWNEWGEPNGFPLIHFHGMNNCRMEGMVFENACLNNKFRLISLDRPGCGESTWPTDNNLKENYNFDTYMKDVTQLLNHLKIENNNFGILGVSQGATFTMGALRYLPQLSFNPKFGVLWVGLPLTPLHLWNNNEYEAAVPKLVRRMFDTSDTLQSSLSMEFQRLMILYATNYIVNQTFNTFFDENDKNVTSDKLEGIDGVILKEIFGEMWKECMKNGVDGMKWSWKITSKNKWNFDFKDIANDQKIFMFYGQTDAAVPCQWGKLYFQHLTNECGLNNITYHEFENAGHLVPRRLINQGFSQMRNFIEQLKFMQGIQIAK